jgi:hydroxypyruvate isomerase
VNQNSYLSEVRWSVSNRQSPLSVNRRQLLQVAAGAVGALALPGVIPAAEPEVEKVASKGNIRHSAVPWCFEPYWSFDELCKIASQLGCKSVELCPPTDWPTVKKYGLTCAIAPSHLFVQGMNNPKYQAGCLEMLRKRIDECADAGVKTVITFTGYAEESGEWADGVNPDLTKLPPNRAKIDPETGANNCVTGFKKIMGYAEEKKINLAMEMLNTRAGDHPMKGHPGYQGNHIDYCMDIVNRIGSPRFGLLFDLYHVEIMDGDLVRRIHQCKEAIKHIHTAGVPGRGELNEDQEINFRPCMKALVEIGYEGFVGHEFIPQQLKPLAGLIQAIRACDI